ncbi:BamA/TamA family outer membrane protein, partial [candidate division WOR-3 bacterium]|nr:BamA/TamA family outer membrane protein [candidate division WOR-3 bacterium]
MRGYLHIPIISILLSILPLYGEEPLTIGDVRFEGNETFSDNQLRSIIRLERGEKYDQFLIAINKFQLKNFYKQMGFLNVMQRWEKIVEKNEVESIIYIEEGTRAVIDTVKFHHNTVFDDNTVRNISGLKQPLPLVQSDILLARFNLLRAYSRKGHIHAQVITDTVQISKNHYLLNFYIDEGNPVYISDIILKGNRTVRNKVIKRRIGIGKGDVCNPEKIAESQFAIYGTGLFESVRHEIEESEGDSVSIIFYLRERPARAITFSTGYIYSDRNPNRLSIRLGWRHNNLWGNAQRIGIRPHFETDFAGYETRGIKLTYGEPHLFGTLYEAGLNLYLNREIRGRASQTVTGSNINLGRHIGRYDQGYIRYQYESIISRKSNIKRSKSSSVFASFSHSRKNDIFYPTRGLVVLLNLQYAGGVLGGDVDYNKAIIENIVYNKV